MIEMIRCEFRKLGGSLALLLAVLAPALPGVLVALSTLSAARPATWAQVIDQFALPLWAMFLLPMILAALTALIAQIEHRARGWDHLLALPIARWRLFAAKAIVVLAITVAMTGLMLLFAVAGAHIGGFLSGRAPQGDMPWPLLVRRVPEVLGAAVLMIALQLWTALRFSNFVVPLAVGIGGTLVTMAAAITGTRDADLFPWVLPFRTLTSPDPLIYVLVGTGGGVFVLGLMVAHLARHSFR